MSVNSTEDYERRFIELIIFLVYIVLIAHFILEVFFFTQQ